MAEATANSPSPFPYSELVREHFLHPRHYLMGDEAKFAHDGRGVAGNPVCGDEMVVLIKVAQNAANEPLISEIAWKTYGCASAIAATSALAELAEGQTLAAAAAITAEEVAAALGGLPKHKFHCSVLGFEALRAAIADYNSETTTK